MAGQFSFGETEVCNMHVHVLFFFFFFDACIFSFTEGQLHCYSLTPHLLPWQFLVFELPQQFYVQCLLYQMILTKNWICEGNEIGYARTIGTQDRFLIIHGLVVLILLPSELETKDFKISLLHLQAGVSRYIYFLRIENAETQQKPSLIVPNLD